MAKYLIFDFNGTVLDDLDVCIRCVNEMIERYLDREPLTKEEYREVFTFPVKDYYTAVGFDWNKLSFEEVGREWFELYCSYKNDYKVFDNAIALLKKNREMGNKNILLSASSLPALKKQLEELEIEEYFDEVLGIDNIYASSKIPIAKAFMKDKDPDDCVMIGDTLHDLSVAKAIGIRCVLVSNGHQSKRLLLSECDEVYDDISEVKL